MRRGRFRVFGSHLHQQIVIPLVLAAFVVALGATAAGVGSLSRILTRWSQDTLRRTSDSALGHLDERRSLLSSHVALLCQDERLTGAIRAGSRTHARFDSSGVAEYFINVRPAIRNDNLALLDADGRVLASAGELSLAEGAAILPQRHVRWTRLGMPYATILPLAGRETLTSFGHVTVDGVDYTLVGSDVIAEGMLREAYAGIGAGLAYFDDGKRLVARYVDAETAGAQAAGVLAARLSTSSPEVAEALAHPGETFRELELPEGRFLMLARPFSFGETLDPTGGRGYLLAVIPTNVTDSAGAATQGLMAAWAFVGIAVLTAFGLIVSRRVSAPLARLAESARLVAEGDFSHKVPQHGDDEVADLAASFNQMTDSLRQRTDAITKKVLELTTLYEMSRSLGSTLEIETLLDCVLDSALRVFDVEAGYVVLRDRDSDRLELKAWRGFDGEHPDERALRSSMSEWVVREGRPLIYNPSADGEQAAPVDGVSGATSALCVPLVSGEGIVGAVTVGSRVARVRFTGDDVRLLSTIANHATVAIGNIDLFSSLQEAYIATVRALAAAVDAKDPYTRGHSDRVAEYAMSIAEHLDLSADQRTALEMAAYLHDIGKIGIPEEILLKPGRLADDEMAQMRHHPLIGANILRPVAFPWAIAPIVRHHHERWDGRGYPAGLRGEEIPFLARILTVADSYEAMTSDRPYRPDRTDDEALEELRRCAGTQFDPRIVDTFAEALGEAAREREAHGADHAEDVQTDEARAIFVAVCNGMLSSFRRLGGPRLCSNLEADLNRWFLAEELPCTFSGGRLHAKWDGCPDPAAEVERMREVVGSLAAAMAHTSGGSLVDGFYDDAVCELSHRMRRLAGLLALYRRDV